MSNRTNGVFEVIFFIAFIMGLFAGMFLISRLNDRIVTHTEITPEVTTTIIITNGVADTTKTYIYRDKNE